MEDEKENQEAGLVRHLSQVDNSVEEEFDCPESDGYFGSRDCGYYYHCSHGSSRRLSCSPGLGWNKESKNCDWIHKLSHCHY